MRNITRTNRPCRTVKCRTGVCPWVVELRAFAVVSICSSLDSSQTGAAFFVCLTLILYKHAYSQRAKRSAACHQQTIAMLHHLVVRQSLLAVLCVLCVCTGRAGSQCTLKHQSSCFPGTYSIIQAGISCTTCDAGKYAAHRATVCIDCVPGTYAYAAAGKCIQCPGGHYCPTTVDCTACMAGKAAPLDHRIAPIVQLEAMQLPRHQSAPSVLVDTIAHFYQQREQWLSPRAALENMPPWDQRRASFVLVEVIQQQVQHSAPIVPLDGIVRKKQREAPHVPLVGLEHMRVLQQRYAPRVQLEPGLPPTQLSAPSALLEALLLLEQ